MKHIKYFLTNYLTSKRAYFCNIIRANVEKNKIFRFKFLCQAKDMRIKLHIIRLKFTERGKITNILIRLYVLHKNAME